MSGLFSGTNHWPATVGVRPAAADTGAAYAAAAGIESSKVKYSSVPFEEIHRGAWDGKARVAEAEAAPDGSGGWVIVDRAGHRHLYRDGA